ncbi:patatin-domain-containing protein [Microthyrium microscopicum]|uniref:Patatin-like phospholipase domain-containing protein n=1 Tax=Microthyrium microscopicum TaxID=703497 RepID=A0A6A6UKI5_9PEZI|nr:patatin-domain-containing protein [Microthyrium microscopicum]
MADISKETDGPPPTDPDHYDITSLPDWDNAFTPEEDIAAFANALSAPEPSPSQDDLTALTPVSRGTFVTALNDWRPVRQRVRKRKKKPTRGRDETREGYLYNVLKWPFLLTVLGWIIFLGVSYLFTRLYIFTYEHWITWRGRREVLRRSLREQMTYQDWVRAATKLDAYLGNDRWKTTEDNAYYDSRTIKKVRNHMRVYRQEAETDEKVGLTAESSVKAVDELRALAEASIRDNFAGFESPRLYSETYYGCKGLQQSFVDEAETSLSFLEKTKQLELDTKHHMWKHIQTNFGRTALCLSGGATFAYYHFGVAKALMDADLLPQVITGTSGGALVAALLSTRTDDELKQLLVPALAHKISACHDSTWTWFRRWWRTGARFDSVDWARRCSWFTRGSMTFKEAYERTGRILNISCVPSDPHSPTILANYLTSPDCVIWTAVLASAAVPGILNPIVLMRKKRDGTLEPYSFGHKWKDGSLRTDIPLKALNLHFNVNFTIVSQVNPHINLFFFSSRGTVGRPVTHRRGRGWRGGYLGSAIEQYLKLDLTKWLKVLKHLELLPRPMGQDWSQLWLQRFSGTITIWPKSIPSDFIYILSDPSTTRLARMLHTGQLSTWPKLLFIGNRLRLEKIIEQGRKSSRPKQRPNLPSILSDDDIQTLLKNPSNGLRRRIDQQSNSSSDDSQTTPTNPTLNKPLPSTPTNGLTSRVKSWFSRSSTNLPRSQSSSSLPNAATRLQPLYSPDHSRRDSLIVEMARQSQVFYDDDDFDESASEGEKARRRRNEYRRFSDAELSDVEGDGSNGGSEEESVDGSVDGNGVREDDEESVEDLEEEQAANLEAREPTVVE